MIKDFLKRNKLYFSDTLDLTCNQQALFSKQTTNYTPSSYIFPNMNSNFCWNYNCTRHLDVSGLEGFIYPIINGFVEVRTVSDYSEEFNIMHQSLIQI